MESQLRQGAGEQIGLAPFRMLALMAVVVAECLQGGTFPGTNPSPKGSEYKNLAIDLYRYSHINQ
jgi:hypothetical protein